MKKNGLELEIWEFRLWARVSYRWLCTGAGGGTTWRGGGSSLSEARLVLCATSPSQAVHSPDPEATIQHDQPRAR